MDLLLNILQQGMIYAIMALGVYITYKILDFPDLTTDGSFALGGAVCAILLTKGINPFIALIIAFFAGIIAGLVTGSLNVYLKIKNLLCGIIVMTALYSINIKIMGGANLPISSDTTIFKNMLNYKSIIIALILGLCFLLLYLFLKTKLGFVLKATGDNPQMVTSLGIDTRLIKLLGVALANGLIALSGGLLAQTQNFADVSMGVGIIVMGLTAIIIGSSIKGQIKLPTILFVIIGAIIYQGVITLALNIGFEPSDLKLIMAVIIVVILSLNTQFGGEKNA